MARFARVVAIDTPHHITQRGNARRLVFESDSDRLVYLNLLQEYSRLHALSLLGYCLMTNHVHLVAIPHRLDSLSVSLRHTHGRYAAYLNARQQTSGHVWQGRYYSCPLDEPHLWAALRYSELNPVRAGLVTTPQEYPWSSAAAHLLADDNGLLELQIWRERWSPSTWGEFLGVADSEGEVEEQRLRISTHTGRPLGSQSFTRNLERQLARKLEPQKGGRPCKEAVDASQAEFAFS